MKRSYSEMAEWLYDNGIVLNDELCLEDVVNTLMDHVEALEEEIDYLNRVIDELNEGGDE